MHARQLLTGFAVIFMGLGTLDASAQDLDKASKALGIISSFANEICNSPEMRGKLTTIEAQGKAQADVSKLIKKLADINIDGAIRFGKSEYEGMLQKDLLPALQDSTRCKERIFGELKDRFLPTTSRKGAALNISVRPDTVGIGAEKYEAVSYFFQEMNGIQVTVDAQDTRWLLNNGSEISRAMNGRVLGGSFTVNPNGSHELRDNVYLPSDIVRKVHAAGDSQVLLETIFAATDAGDRRTKARAVLRISILE